MPPPDCVEEFGAVLQFEAAVANVTTALGAQRVITTARRQALLAAGRALNSSLTAENTLLAELATAQQGLTAAVAAYQTCRAGGVPPAPEPLTAAKKKRKRKA